MEWRTIFVVAWLVCAILLQVESGSAAYIKYLNNSYSSPHSTPGIFCYIPGKVNVRDLWATVHVRISSQVGVKVTKGVNATEVSEHIQSWLGWVTSNLRSGTHQESISLDLFEQTCFRVECAKTYIITVVHTRYDLWLIGCLVLGLLLFFYADSLSRSASFLYTSGVLLGVFASLLVIIFVLSRLLPAKRNVFFMIVASGWSMAVFMMQRVYRNLGTILSQHWQIVIGYFVTVGCISFAVCYRHGPLRDERSIQLLSWALQLVSLSLIYLGIQIPKFSLTVVIIVVSVKFIDLPIAGLSWLYRVCRRQRSVALPKLLSEEEYQLQAKVETRRALEALRCSCRSPEVDSWKIVSRLSSPSRLFLPYQLCSWFCSAYLEGTIGACVPTVLPRESQNLGAVPSESIHTP
uniref:nuclear envelope integral membrane protein 1-like isoform X2 n=1 Tax=Myxine glutinosa TaxID=7769 RepID=UPI00358E09D5